MEGVVMERAEKESQNVEMEERVFKELKMEGM